MTRLRQSTNQLFNSNGLQQAALILLLLSASVGFGFMLTRTDSLISALILPVGALALVFAWQQPEILTVALLGITWGYISEILVKYHDMPSIAKPLVVLLAVIVVGRRFFKANTSLAQHRLQWWMVAYLLVVCFGLWYADYPARTELVVIDFAKEILLLFVIINLLTSERWFERSIWAMLIVGSVIGTLTCYQELTRSYGNEFGGLARSTIAQIAEGVSNRARAGGPTGEPNAFGQQMLVLVPIGVWAALFARRISSRLFGGYAAFVCLVAAGLSFSRGTYLALLMMVIASVVVLRLNPRYLLVLPLVYFALAAAPSELRARFGTLDTLLPGAAAQNEESDASIRRRSVEMWVAAYMFFDHPFIGVGADNFVPHYPDYIRELGSDVNDEQRNAHSYYLEIAAEHGMLGLIVVGGIFVLSFVALQDARRRFKALDNERMAELAAALQVAFIGYAVSAIFLHGDYSRFLWLQVDLATALSLVASYATKRELEHALEEQSESALVTQPAHS